MGFKKHGRETMRELLIVTFSAWLVALCFLAVTPACAQLTTADVLGTVTDAAGGAVSTARVTIVNTATRDTRTAQTGASGDFVVNLLPPGQYTVTVEAPGFKRSVASLTLIAGDRARADAQLQ